MLEEWTYVKDERGRFRFSEEYAAIARTPGQKGKPAREPHRGGRAFAKDLARVLNEEPLKSALAERGAATVKVLGEQRTDEEFLDAGPATWTTEAAKPGLVSAICEQGLSKGAIAVNDLRCRFRLLTTAGTLCKRVGVKQEKSAVPPGPLNLAQIVFHFGKTAGRVAERLEAARHDLQDLRRKTMNKVQEAIRGLGHVDVATSDEGQAVVAAVNGWLQDFGLRLQVDPGVPGYLMYDAGDENGQGAAFYLRALNGRSRKSLATSGFAELTVVEAPPDRRRIKALQSKAKHQSG